MINHLYTVSAAGYDPVVNLAAESVLFDRAEKNAMIFYLWQNDNTIVIGRNQNYYRECRLKEMAPDHVKVVRRPSGGGAVYHDRGNLNFTFITDDENFDIPRQTGVILKALEKRGIRAGFSGRNDLLADGHKFSGNAYYHHNGFSYHHGTLLIDSDLSKAQKYLNPDPLKLKANSVSSVRSRIMNLKEADPSLDIEEMKTLLLQACEEEYGIRAEQIDFPDCGELREFAEKYGSDHWIKGKNPPFDLEIKERFRWGSIVLRFTVKKGTVSSVTASSDAMEQDEILKISELLSGCEFSSGAMCEALKNQGSLILDDLAVWLKEQEL